MHDHHVLLRKRGFFAYDGVVRETGIGDDEILLDSLQRRREVTIV